MIIVDSHEVANNPEIEKVLEDLGIEYRVEEIRFDGVQIGDYTNEERTFIVERKKADFWNIPHTLEQLEKMKDLPIKKYLFIEGTRNDLLGYLYKIENSKTKRNWGQAVLAKASVHYGIEVCFFKNQEEIFSHMYWIDREIAKEAEPFLAPPRWMGDEYLTLLCGIKGLGPSKARALLDRFATPLNVFLATDEELAGVRGIGKEMIARIRRYTE